MGKPVRSVRRIGFCGGLVLLLAAGSCEKKVEEQPKVEASPSRAASAREVAVPKSAEAQPTASPKRYDIESGRIEYEQSGMLTGIETLVFMDFGRKELRESQVKLKLPDMSQFAIGHMPANRHTITVIDNDTLVSYDPSTKAGTKLTNAFEFFGGKSKLSGQNLTHIGMAMVRSLGGKKTGTKTVAGYTCDLWQIESLKGNVCLYKGVSLEATVKVEGMDFRTLAKKVDFKADISEEKFAVPADVKLKEMDAKQLIEKGTGPRGAQPAAAGSGSGTATGTRLTPERIKTLQRELKDMTER